MTGASVLVVDDESGIRSTIEEILSDEGYAVQTAADASEARKYYAGGNPDLVLLDIWMPDMDGITLLKLWSEAGSLKCPVVVMSGHGSVESAVEATRLGAFDYIEKPLSLAQLLRTVETALRHQPEIVVQPEVSRKSAPLSEAPLGKSPLIEAAREQAREIAGQAVPVLITGETGSGRDLFGRYIHDSSSRADKPFVWVSGASLTNDNALDQLVGVSGLQGEEIGLLQQAEGGTLFISELQDLSSKAQSLLLSFIEQRSYTRPGRAQSEVMDVHFIASIQHHIGESVRADILAAMGVMQLSVPSLRDYSADIPGLLSHYATDFVDRENLHYRRFSMAAQNRLRNYPWPGNLRELKNLVRHMLTVDGPEEIGLRELESSLRPPSSSSEPLVKQDLLALPMREAREHFERAYLTQQLALCGGRVGKLAERVGMERTHLYRKLRALGVDFRQSNFDN
jgi:two-component system nitrogen regulation response regulator NtrX